MHRRAREQEQVPGRRRLSGRPEEEEVTRSQRRSLLIRAGSAAACLWLLGCGSMGSGAHGAADESHPLIGAPAPAFELPAPTGKGKVSLASHAGKVVVVDFWA